MATRRAEYPDVEDALCDLLLALGPTYSFTPDELPLPCFRVQRIGGTDDGITDAPRAEVTTFAATRAEAWLLARQAQQMILASINTAPGRALLDGARTDSGPQHVPYGDRTVWQVTATYRLALRRPR